MKDTDLKYTRQIVTARHSWMTDKLFSLRVTRDPSFDFIPGQFARLGLPLQAAQPNEPSLWRAYSMVSAPNDSELEFYSIVVPEGEFSPRLARLQTGDTLYIEKKPYGFLTLERFTPGGTLWLLASGTGLSAYMSMLRSATVWRDYDRIILVHGVRHAQELAYRNEIMQWPTQATLVPYFAHEPRKLTYLPIATRERLPGMPQARLTTLLDTGQLETLADAPLDPSRDKIMLCGNPEMLNDARQLLSKRGFAPGRRGIPGNLAVENYW